ncbi:zinc-binding alcohol dehydrogenase family protein [Hymenobacter sp. GOD-10R]|uniref:zinc-binding alcohol dehydrogenase family protein n=1 Tax=Hymenobacter sp. GOD-10R TaxID=3093922 RepID=UPI002D782E6E|nr:zinc-binding alcohol dehydrogenase family protein [Hymenobacter sp. GOD-10R]WRQ30677.1 zinc-binding alcohol dehydrogenase family protein [Hymenobacter sp. GOD-10R]
MNALTYQHAHELAEFDLHLQEVPLPTLRDSDLLIRVQAFAVNPGDTVIRRFQSAAPGQAVILGWEFAGIVEQVGPHTTGFQPGDAVYGAGDLSRDGNYADYVAVDYRVVARKPANLSFPEAAALPMSFQTAWGALLRNDNQLPAGVGTVLVLGGAGGIGSIAIQLLKTHTNAMVIATASRPASKQWVAAMGADMVLDHSQDLAAQLAQHGIERVDMVLATRSSASHLAVIPQLLKAYGHLSLLDVHQSLDVSGLTHHSISVHLENVFTRVITNQHPEQQGLILRELTKLVEAGKVTSTLQKTLSGLTSENIRTAHEVLEKGEMIGKLVLDLGSAR